MELSDVFAGAALSAGPSQQAASAAPSLGQTLADAWDTVVYGVSWFFGNMEPAGIWAIPTLAAAIAFSRLYLYVHWPSDVLGGAVLGSAVGWAGAWLVQRAEQALARRRA